jgi:RimJ/RimL family protein N-acetyltransferase
VSFSIRQLTSKDVDLYRPVRAEALSAHPEAFGQSPEEFAQRGHQELAELLDRLDFFGAFDPDGSLVGLMAFDQGNRPRDRHRGWLLQVYVLPRMRGTGCAQALLEAVIAHAQSRVRQLHLSVASGNEPALRLYQKAGFVLYGTDPAFQYVNGRYVDEHLMVRFFDKAPGEDQ